jgi:GTP-binding protein
VDSFLVRPTSSAFTWIPQQSSNCQSIRAIRRKCRTIPTPIKFSRLRTLISSSVLNGSKQQDLEDEKLDMVDEYNMSDKDDTTYVKTYYSPNKPLDRKSFLDDDDDNPITSDTFDESTTSLQQQQAHHEYSFYDEATIVVRAGSGGQGASTYKKGTGGQDGPPDGGSGGRGGNVWLVVDDSLNTLAGLTYALRPNAYGGSGAAVSAAAGGSGGAGNGGKDGSNTNSIRPRLKSFRAENGANGNRQFKNGRSGVDVTIRVPPGTVVREIIEHEDNTGYGVNGEERVELGTLLLDERPSLLVARGGEGGEGSGINTKGRGVHRPRVPPEGGQRKLLQLTLKLVADVALVGVPNAGKSTFLSAVTRAKPKIANYPFTTVIPNLGVWVPPESYSKSSKSSNAYNGDDASGGEGLVLCDVPGLVKGASRGVGLGHAFLRHVERCHVILHLIDATSDDPVADFQMLNRELVKYGTGQLAQMPQVVVVNKLDALERSRQGQGNVGMASGKDDDDSSSPSWEDGLETRVSSREELEVQLKEVMSHSRLMWMSAREGDGVDDLMMRMATFVKKVKAVT